MSVDWYNPTKPNKTREQKHELINDYYDDAMAGGVKYYFSYRNKGIVLEKEEFISVALLALCMAVDEYIWTSTGMHFSNYLRLVVQREIQKFVNKELKKGTNETTIDANTISELAKCDSIEEEIVSKIIVGDLLDQLKKRQRVVINMLFFQNYSVSELAALDGVSYHAVYGTKMTALKNLANLCNIDPPNGLQAERDRKLFEEYYHKYKSTFTEVQRAIMEMCYFEGMTSVEASKKLNVDVKTVRYLRNNGSQKLRDRIRRPQIRLQRSLLREIRRLQSCSQEKLQGST